MKAIVYEEYGSPDVLWLEDVERPVPGKPVIERTYSLREAANALRYLEQGHAKGKVVVTIGN